MTGRFSRLELGSGARSEEHVGGASFAAADKALAGTPARSAGHFHSQASAAARAGQFEQGLQLYTRALREDRALLPAWVGQVQMLVELSEFREARLWADKALELFRGNGDLLAAKSRACLRHGDRAAALMSSDASLQSPGSSPDRWVARGEVMLDSRGARARDCFEKALTEPGADWFVRVAVARTYLFHRKPAPGFEFADAAVRCDATQPYAWVVRGWCLRELGQDARAAESGRCALDLDARCPAARELISALESGSSPGLIRRLKGWLTQ